MSKLYRKNRIENIDYKGVIQEFLEKDESVAFIPKQQKDTNRFNWHSAAEELNVGHKTLKLWMNLKLCGAHNRPIIGLKPGEEEFDIEHLYAPEYSYECNYECSDEECCYEDDETQLSKMRTVVIFNKEGADKIKDMKVEQIKEYLVQENVVQIVDGKYHIDI
jgi:hypothetical protein